jgi:LPXTG-motif cell wall-anchored protein
MKTIILFCLLFILSAGAFAQPNSDSLAYQQQRKKINAMLAARAQKFGQYSESLDMHSGIFGLQTKKDIRRSNDILMDIVKTDDSIYKELKILLEYRTFQQTQVQSHSTEAENSNLGYATTINKLRAQVDQLKADAGKQQPEIEKEQRIYMIAIIVMLALILLLIFRKRKRTA